MEKLRRHLGTLMMIVGIAIMVIVIAGNIYYRHLEQQKLREYADIMSTNFTDDFDEHEALTADAGDVIGTITIPKIDVEEPIIEGSTAAELRYGAGHVTSTVMPGEQGNCAIASHRSHAFGKHFNRLGEIEVGDTFIIKSNGMVLNYVVYDVFIVLPTELSVLDNTEDSGSIVTLITCAPAGSNTHRLIVRGRIDTEPDSQQQTQ